MMYEARLPQMPIREERSRIMLGIAVGIFIAAGILFANQLSSTYLPVILGGFVMSVVGAIIPEFSAAVLYTGMAFWSLAPQLDAVSGYRIPLTIGWVTISYATHAFAIDRRKLSLRWTKLDSVLLLFCSFTACSLIWSSNEFYGGWKIATFFLSSVASVWLLRSFYVKRMMRLALLVKVLASMSVLMVTLVVITSIEVGGIEGFIPGLFYSERRVLFDQNYGLFATSDALMVSGLCVAFILLSSDGIGPKVGWGLLLCACIWALLVLGQRSQFLTLTLCGAFLYWGLKVRGIKLSMPKIVGVISAVAFIGIGIWSQIEFNSRSSFEHLKDDDSITNRFLRYNVAFEAFSENPIIGTGLGDYAKYARRNSYKLQGASGRIGTTLATDLDRSFPHNIFLEILAENGFVGLLLWLIFIYVVSRETVNTLRYRSSPYFGIAMLGCAWLLARALVSLSNGDLGTLFIGPCLLIISAVALVNRNLQIRIDQVRG
jgi:O-antigen ligase